MGGDSLDTLAAQFSSVALAQPSMYTTLRLPQELIDLIIDHLHDDHAALEACALTSSAWLPRSRTHLHRCLRLACAKHCTKARNLYAGNQFLAGYIREVLIFDPHHRSESNEHQHHCEPWLVNEVSPVLKKLRTAHVQALLVHSVHRMPWTSHEPPLCPTITRLVLRRVDFAHSMAFVALMADLPHLSSLFMKDVSFVQREGVDPSCVGPRPPLRTMDIVAGSAQEFVLNWFLHQPMQSIGLTHLTYSIDRWRVTAPSSCLQALGKSVEHLTIVFAYESPHYLLKGDPLLSYFTALHTLSFDFATVYGTLYGPASIPVLLQYVRARAISCIRFRFALENRYVALDDSLQKISRIRLAETDRQLNTLEAFGALADVAIEVRSNEWTKLMRLQTPQEWIRVELEQKRASSARASLRNAKLAALSPLASGDASASASTLTPMMDPLGVVEEAEFEWPRKDVDWEKSLIQRAQADYDKTRLTWMQAREALCRALPQVHKQMRLTIEPVEVEPPDSTSTSRRLSAHFPRHHPYPHLPGFFI